MLQQRRASEESVDQGIMSQTQFTPALCDNLSRRHDGLRPMQSGSPSVPSPTQPKPNTGCSAQRHRKLAGNGPKIKKLKYHQYISPDHKGDKEPPLRPDSSSSSIVQQQQQQQQQLFLQLLILGQQHQSCSCHPSSSLDEMKVADLRSELKLRSLPAYGTKTHLIERLRAYEEAGGGTSASPPAGGTVGPGAEGAGGALGTSTATHSASRRRQTPDARRRLRPLANASAQPADNSSSPSRKRLNLQSRLAAQPPTASTASLLTANKDEMLRKKDEQIEVLTRMLRQEQTLLEALKMQLELGGRGRVPDPLVLVRVRQQPPDEPSVARSCGRPPAAPSQVDVKQEAAEALKFPELPQLEQIMPQIKLEHVNLKGAAQGTCLQHHIDERRQQGNVQSQRTKCHLAQQQILLHQKPLTPNTKQIKLLINLNQQQLQMQKHQVHQPRQLFPPPIPPSCHLQFGLDDAEQERGSGRVSGRLEDFLESATGTPLLGVEPGGLVALIDDLHSQMLCSPSVLDRPPSPVEPFDWSAEVQQGVKINDWLHLNAGAETDEETQVPPGPQTPGDMFSTDFLDSTIL